VQEASPDATPTRPCWITATSLQHGLPLVTRDRHFEQIDGLIVGSSLAAIGRRTISSPIGSTRSSGAANGASMA
jgi:hypothetical protein